MTQRDTGACPYHAAGLAVGSRYFVGPFPWCEVTKSTVVLVASALFGTCICVVPEEVVCIGVPVPFAVTLAQEVS